MNRALILTALLLSSVSMAFGGTVRAPEIDGSAAAAAVTLLAGSIVVLRSRRKKS